MSRFSFVLAASLVAVVAVAACSAGPIAPPASPSAAPASPLAPPIVTPPPSVTPPPAAPPSVTPPPAIPAPTKPPVIATPQPTPRPTAPSFTADEQDLLDGVQRGTKNCEPAGGSDDLPRDAIAGIECDSTHPGVARIGFYLFANNEDMVNAYLFRMNAEGVKLDSGSCNDGEAEGAYIPYEGFALDRAGCFLNDEGFANYRFTMTGKHPVYIGILGRSADMVALETFAWQEGNPDTPGFPTLWFGGID
jgi:hypothetical protein